MKLITKGLSIVLSAAMVTSAVMFPSGAFASDAPKAEYAKGEAIAVLKEDAPKNAISSLNKVLDSSADIKNSYSFEAEDKNNIGDLTVVTYKSDSLSTYQLIRKLEKNANVEYAIPNYKMKATSITDDTYSDYQYALNNVGQNGGTVNSDINPEYQWDKAAENKEEAVVAVLDTGVDYTNEDLKDVIWNNPYGAKLFGKHGYDFCNDDTDPMDDFGHGSHCAGIIAASANNQKGISGVNKSGVKIMALKWLDDSGSGFTDDVIAAYDYVSRAIKLGTNVVAINNSWGGIGDAEEIALFSKLFDELGEMGAISFVAAGNDTEDLDSKEVKEMNEDGMYNIPVQVDSKYSVNVASSNGQDELSCFSSYGKETVDIAAPGSDILSTVSYDCYNPTIYSSEKRDKITKEYSTYEDGVFAEGTFGYAKTNFIGNTTLGHEIVDASLSVSDEHYFGKENAGKSLKASIDIGDKNESYSIIEIPYTLENKDDNYAISLMCMIDNEGTGLMYDVPQSATIKSIAEGSYLGYSLGAASYGYSWFHSTYNINVKDEAELGSYEKDVNRKIVLLIDAQKSCNVYIDNVSISKQGVDFKEFEKYDFYNGTSMATPYAAGAYALIRNAYKDASTLEAKSMLENTGRVVDSLSDKVRTSRVISLEDITKIPPIIAGAKYNNDGDIVIDGGFRDITKISVNDQEVTPKSQSNKEIIISDNDFNTKKLNIVVENAYGSDSYTTIISNKIALEKVEDVFVSDEIANAKFLSAGDITYAVTTSGSILQIQKPESLDYGEDDIYSLNGDYYDEPLEDEAEIEVNDIGMILASEIDKNATSIEVSQATYLGEKIYAIARIPQYTSTFTLIGYDTYFVEYDINSKSTKKISEVALDTIEGFTLATYNSEIYLIGGYDYNLEKYNEKTYRFSSDTKKFVDTGKKLPEGQLRAYGNAIQYENKLVYAFGSNENGSLPNVLVYDGSGWKTSTLALESDDCTNISYNNGTKAKLYNGTISIAENGVLLCGTLITGYGDISTYDVNADKLVASKYGYKKSLKDDNLVATTVPGKVVAFAVSDDEVSVLQTDIETTHATLDISTLEHGYFEYSPISAGYGHIAYGDKLVLTVVPDKGYVVTKIIVNSKEYNVVSSQQSKPTQEITITSKNTKINATLKQVSPAKVTGLKVSATSSSSYTLTWKKPARANGYYVQEYVSGAWKTIATITDPSKLTYKVSSPSVKTHKYRVCAYAVYAKKTYVSDASSTKTIIVAKKQTIKTLSTASKAFKVTVTKNSSATGYQIQYATNSKFSSAKTKTIKGSKNVTSTISKLSSKKKYYVRVRSYKTVDGLKVYGAWSNAKTVTTK